MTPPHFHSIRKELRHPLRIAQLAPLCESVPPKLYGGTERVVAYLTEELVRRGHEVTLFASGDSTANAKIQATYPAALRAVGLAHMGASLQVPALSEVFDRSDHFDIIHPKCREVFETRFTADAMAANYERIYYQLISVGRARPSRNGAGPACNVTEAAVAGEETPG